MDNCTCKYVYVLHTCVYLNTALSKYLSKVLYSSCTNFTVKFNLFDACRSEVLEGIQILIAGYTALSPSQFRRCLKTFLFADDPRH